MDNEQIDTSSFLSPAKASEKLGVHRQTLANWAKKGKIHCMRHIGGMRRYDVKRFIRENASDDGYHDGTIDNDSSRSCRESTPESVVRDIDTPIDALMDISVKSFMRTSVIDDNVITPSVKHSRMLTPIIHENAPCVGRRENSSRSSLSDETIVDTSEQDVALPSRMFLPISNSFGTHVVNEFEKHNEHDEPIASMGRVPSMGCVPSQECVHDASAKSHSAMLKAQEACELISEFEQACSTFTTKIRELVMTSLYPEFL